MGPLPDLLLATTGMEEEEEEDEVGKGIFLGINRNGKANHHLSFCTIQEKHKSR